MPAIVVLENVSITRVGSNMNRTVLDGTVTLRIRSDGIDAQYVHNFGSMQDVPGAVQLAAKSLKRELEALAEKAQNVLQNTQN